MPRSQRPAGLRPSRRGLLRGGLGLAGAAVVAALSGRGLAAGPEESGHAGHGASGEFTMPTVVGEVDHAANGFDPPSCSPTSMPAP
jgi:hypothetical protein